MARSVFRSGFRCAGHAALLALALSLAGCAHGGAAAEEAEQPSESESATKEVDSSPHAEHREDSGKSKRPSRVYTREELDSTGENDLDDAMRKLGHQPR